MKNILIIILSFAAILLPGLTSAQMMGWGNGWNMGGFMGTGWIFGLIFWVLIIIGIIWLIKCLTSGCGAKWHDKKDDSAVEILKQRYAKGEIKKEEFEEKMKDLNK